MQSKWISILKIEADKNALHSGSLSSNVCFS